jgi:hypothetical protein
MRWRTLKNLYFEITFDIRARENYQLNIDGIPMLVHNGNKSPQQEFSALRNILHFKLIPTKF